MSAVMGRELARSSSDLRISLEPGREGQWAIYRGDLSAVLRVRTELGEERTVVIKALVPGVLERVGKFLESSGSKKVSGIGSDELIALIDEGAVLTVMGDTSDRFRDGSGHSRYVHESEDTSIGEFMKFGLMAQRRTDIQTFNLEINPLLHYIKRGPAC